MKTRCSLLLVSATLLLIHPVVGANLAAFWPAEGNSADAAGVYHGSLLGGVTFTSGRSGQAFAFDGSTGWIVATPSTNLNLLAGATLMAWVRLDYLPSVAGHIMYVVGKSQSGNDFDIQIETDDRTRFYIGGGLHVSSTTLVQTGIWYHIAATYRPGERIELFLNGVREDYLDTSILVASNPNPFTLGASAVFGGRYFEGCIDQVRLYDGALSAAEIQSVYASESGRLPSPRLNIRISQVEVCWDTSTNAAYQLQYRSELTTNNWLPFFTNYWPGTGGLLCTNDVLPPDQPQRFYHVVATNLVASP